ncbi:hypothetical protein OSTOST_03231 [Ostertagia ostertagi]
MPPTHSGPGAVPHSLPPHHSVSHQPHSQQAPPPGPPPNVGRQWGGPPTQAAAPPPQYEESGENSYDTWRQQQGPPRQQGDGYYGSNNQDYDRGRDSREGRDGRKWWRTYKRRFKRARKGTWASVLITLQATVYWLFSISLVYNDSELFCLMCG